MSCKIIHLKSVTSTNDFLKSLAKNGNVSRAAVIADVQTSGRGSRGRVFESPEGGLYLSYLARLDAFNDDIISLTQWACVAVHDAIKRFCGIDCRIKYINDLLIDDKKVCGILTELTGNHLIVGIGINVNTDLSKLSEELRDKTTSLSSNCGMNLNISDLAEILTEELELMINDYPENDWRETYYTDHCVKG